MKQTLEQALTKRAWRDPDFARLLETDPRSALEAIGVEVSGNVIDLKAMASQNSPCLRHGAVIS